MSELRDVISEVRETSTFEPDSEYAATEHWSGVARLLADELESLLDRVETAEQAIARVRELHRNSGASQGYTDKGYGNIEDCCGVCGTFGEYGEPWPCPTIMAVEGDE